MNKKQQDIAIAEIMGIYTNISNPPYISAPTPNTEWKVWHFVQTEEFRFKRKQFEQTLYRLIEECYPEEILDRYSSSSLGVFLHYYKLGDFAKTLLEMKKPKK